MGETFTINVDISGSGIELELFVMPEQDYYTVKLDGVKLVKLKYDHDDYPNWKRLEGKVDQDGVNIIGEAIENKLA